jgi:hypothetical protein
MQENERNSEIGEKTIQVTKTPMFSGFQLWLRAKKESLDLWGMEKYLGCDNRQFKKAVGTFKNLVHEIEQEYQETISALGMDLVDKADAKKHRDQMLLDAKRDFIYTLPEYYRMWFKKKKVFSSWWSEPSSWGFNESRYWGSRSGLSLKERRVAGFTALICIAGLSILLIVVLTKKPNKIERQTTWDTIERPNRNIDSLVQAQLTEDRKLFRRKSIAERNNRIINEINSGVYTTTTATIKAEVKMLMEFYHDHVYKERIPKNVITSEAVASACGIIAANNPNAITKRDSYGNPIQWKMGKRINMTWTDINYGLRSYYNRKNKSK